MEEFDCITIEVLKMERLAIIQDPRYSPSPLPPAYVSPAGRPEGGTVTDNSRKTIRGKTAAL
ncbi:MAG TPA: hypothetical protein DDZ79_06675 [Aequorivita sp.]|nr:hypothetical protein [Aequorivita sp.]